MPKEKLIHEQKSQAETDNRLRELILYISQKCEKVETFGATLLNKILFYSDFNAYLDQGEPITGTVYMREQYGPIPRRLMPVRNKLESKKELAIKEIPTGPRVQKRPIALRAADLSAFTAAQIALVDEVIDQLAPHTATHVSNATHRHKLWQVARDKQDIPYEAAFISDDELTPQEQNYALNLARKNKWNVF